MPTRRRFLQSAPLCAAAGVLARGKTPIDRKAVVSRHNPTFTALDPKAPLSVGNGEFAFTCDITGLQTFPEAFENTIPLCTQSQWGWHNFPAPAGMDLDALKPKIYDTYGRPVPYFTSKTGQQELFDFLRQNPHRLHLGRIGFQLERGDVSETRQTLDLWTGIISSSFQVKGWPVRVRTCCDPRQDMVAVEVESEQPVTVLFDFPYGSPEVNAADWKHAEAHQTKIARRAADSVVLQRTLDATVYHAAIQWTGTATLEQAGPHRFHLTGSRFAFTCRYSPGPVASAPPPSTVMARSATSWSHFWTSGGAVDLDGSTDARARELERRVVLSQYLTAIQCAGTLPPQETGLTCNSWYGKFHLEMHWWHAAHFPMWGRPALLERSLKWYALIEPRAREAARRQGYEGVRWPKMVGPAGIDSPSPVGPLLIWQQPHVISFAEMCYRSNPTPATLSRYAQMVSETADFMTSFAHWDEARKRYVLGPPVIPAQENHPAVETWNPTYELVYWAWGLETAQLWRERAGLPREAAWDRVAKNLSALPVKDGVYLAHENCPQTFTERNRDHPSMLQAYGQLPGRGVDKETMRRTLKKVLKEWHWPDVWGWDFGVMAMTAARLGERELAIDALMMETTKNTYLPNGHNYQRPGLHLYLPGNGAVLAAVAMMAGGWQDGPSGNAPGFPEKGWTVRQEGLKALL